MLQSLNHLSSVLLYFTFSQIQTQFLPKFKMLFYCQIEGISQGSQSREYQVPPLWAHQWKIVMTMYCSGHHTSSLAGHNLLSHCFLSCRLKGQQHHICLQFLFCFDCDRIVQTKKRFPFTTGTICHTSVLVWVQQCLLCLSLPPVQCKKESQALFRRI